MSNSNKRKGQIGNTVEDDPGFALEYAHQGMLFPYISLMDACREGMHSVALALVNEGDRVECIDEDQSTVLTLACDRGMSKVALRLISRRADVNHANKYKDTPLILASKNGMLDVVKSLVRHGAHINHVNSRRKNALMAACQNYQSEVAIWLIRSGISIDHVDNCKNNALLFSCENGLSEVVRCLIDAKSDVNRVDQNGKTGLMLACQRGHHNVVCKLIAAEQIDLNKKTKDGYDALIMACENGFPKIALLLINNGADVGVREGSGALMFACKNKLYTVALALIEKGSNVDAPVNNCIRISSDEDEYADDDDDDDDDEDEDDDDDDDDIKVAKLNARRNPVILSIHNIFYEISRGNCKSHKKSKLVALRLLETVSNVTMDMWNIILTICDADMIGKLVFTRRYKIPRVICDLNYEFVMSFVHATYFPRLLTFGCVMTRSESSLCDKVRLPKLVVDRICKHFLDSFAEDITHMTETE